MKLPPIDDWIRVNRQPKGCKQCHEERDEAIEMEATTAWVPALAAHADIWRCPECGREVFRGDTLTTPDGERF